VTTCAPDDRPAAGETTHAHQIDGLAALPVFYDARMVANAQSFSPSAGKPREVVESWKHLGLPLEFPRFDPASREQLCLAHAPAYVDGILAGQISNGFGNRSMAVANALPWTSGAMLAAARAAITNDQVAVAPVSGFHHARHGTAGGFCTFNGLIVAARALQAEDVARRVGILDFDQHYGDGTDQILRQLGLQDITHYSAGAEYGAPDQADAFLAAIPSRVRQFADCDVLLYQAGADPHIDDPLGGWLTDAQLAQRDRLVFQSCRELGLPVAWNLAGGYQTPLRKVLDIHDATLRACAALYLATEDAL
jgi:acetoin utilization deacetylase AcuC-like enzyme